jgi:hypothetical protein
LKQWGPDRFETIAAYPRINLWPASVKLLFGGEDALPAITEDWNKRFLALGEPGSPRYEAGPVPLGAIYVFDEAEENTETFAPLSQRDALMALVTNTYATNLLDAEQRAEEFAFLSKLVERVPVRKLKPHRGEWSIGRLCHAIRTDFQTIDAGQPLRTD